MTNMIKLTGKLNDYFAVTDTVIKYAEQCN